MRQCVVSVLPMPEREVFVRGLRLDRVPPDGHRIQPRRARAAGDTKYPFRKLVRLGGRRDSGLLRLSTAPGDGIRVVSLAISVAAAAFLIVWKIFNFRLLGHYPAEVPGWTSVVCVILFLGGIQFLILGIMGDFIGAFTTR